MLNSNSISSSDAAQTHDRRRGIGSEFNVNILIQSTTRSPSTQHPTPRRRRRRQPDGPSSRSSFRRRTSAELRNAACSA